MMSDQDFFGYKGYMLPQQYQGGQHNPKSNLIYVKFRLNCRDTQVGEVVKVAGSTAELGSWNPQKALSLTTSPNEFPIWKGQAALDSSEMKSAPLHKLEYKYVIVDEKSGGIRRWEPLVGNRLINLQKIKEVLIEDVYGKPNHVREELKQWEHINQDSKYGDADSENSSSSPGTKKVVRKVRELKNVTEEYLRQKMKSSNYRQVSTPQIGGLTSIQTPMLSIDSMMVNTPAGGDMTGNAYYPSGPHDDVLELKKQISKHACVNVDEDLRLMHSIEDVQHELNHQRRQQRELIYTIKESDDTDFPFTSSNTLGLRQMKSPEIPTQLRIGQTRQVAPGSGGIALGTGGSGSNIITGTTGGMIMADDPTDENDEDDDEMIEEDKRLLEDVKISSEDVVIVASFKLPISLYKDATGAWKTRPSRSLLYPTMFKLREKKKMVNIQWIGWPGVQPDSSKEEQEITEILKEYNCVPAFFDTDTVEQFLYFHETVLRPLFHNFKGLNDFEYDLGKAEYWQKYQQVNAKFASIITELKQEREMIWIHDNYLLLVPTYVRRRDINANIGFFMHCPFPSSDIYKMFPYRGEVLKSLLTCDLIGFHLFEYARNFYTSCRRILGLNHDFKKGGFLGIECFGRNVMLRISHIGIQVEDILEMMETDAYKHYVKYLNQIVYKKRHVISSIDRFHPISGLKNKLLAYQKFLREYPACRQTSCLVQYVVPSDCPKCQMRECSHQMIDQTRTEILTLVKEIEDEFGKSSIHYVEQDLLMEQRLALWAVSSILLITTLRDGQCLPPLEFITVKKYLNKSNKSAVILSEFSGCNRALGGILKINPFNVDEIVKNIDMAITMPTEEREQRFKIAYNYISKHSTLKWAEAFLKDLKRSHQPCENVSKYMILGLGLNQTLIKTRQGFQELKQMYVENDYQRSCNRIIIIDQEGVLPMRGSATNKNLQEPYPNVIQALDTLAKDERNSAMFVISSSTKDLMHKWYAEKAPRLGLAAENGFFWRFDSQDMTEHQWVKLIKDKDFCWIESVKDIMQSYTEKTDGAFIEEKESMIVWNYRETDPDFGNWQAKELTSHLEHVFQNIAIEIVHGKKQLEVVPNQLKKVKLLKLLVESISKKYPIDFILYIGDDAQNEACFTYLNNKKQQMSKMLTGTASVYTCTIGRKATQAKYFLNDPDAVVHLLDALQTVSIKTSKKAKSYAQLANPASASMLNQFKGGTGQVDGMPMLEKSGSDFMMRSTTQKKIFMGHVQGRNSLPMQGHKKEGSFHKFAEDSQSQEAEDEDIHFSGNSSCNEHDVYLLSNSRKAS